MFDDLAPSGSQLDQGVLNIDPKVDDAPYLPPPMNPATEQIIDQAGKKANKSKAMKYFDNLIAPDPSMPTEQEVDKLTGDAKSFFDSLGDGEPTKAVHGGIKELFDSIQNPSGKSSNFLDKLSKVESGGKYHLKPNSAGYEGKYQHRFRPGDDGTKVLKQMGKSLKEWRASPEVQEEHQARIMKLYEKELSNKGIPVNDYTLWLRHNQGLQGAKILLEGKIPSRIRGKIRRNILGQFGKDERKKQGLDRLSDSKLIEAYHKKYMKKFQ